MNIISLIELEWFKYSKNRLFKFAVLFLLILPPGLLFMLSKIKTQPPVPSGVYYISFPQVWDWAAYIMNWSSFFMIGFIAIFIIAYERENNLLKQSIINGLSRNNYFLSKVLFMLTIILGYTLYYILISYVFGMIFTSTEVGPSLNFKLISGIFIMMLLYASMGMISAMLLKRVGIAAITYIIYGMFLENILRYAIHSNIVMNITMNLYPINAAEDLAPFPVPGEMDTMMSEAADEGFNIFLTYEQAAITTLIYISIFLFFTYRMIKKRDL